MALTVEEYFKKHHCDKPVGGWNFNILFALALLVSHVVNKVTMNFYAK